MQQHAHAAHAQRLHQCARLTPCRPSKPKGKMPVHVATWLGEWDSSHSRQIDIRISLKLPCMLHYEHCEQMKIDMQYLDG